MATAVGLAGPLGAEVQVLAVLESLAVLTPDRGMMLAAEVEGARREALLRGAEAHAARWRGRVPVGRIELQEGEPARVIARVAAERGAQLVVVGIGRHELVNRIFGSETALKVVRLSRVPVLAVPANQSEPARRAIVAVDFSEASARAAQAAVQLVTAGGVVQLVHVVPVDHMLGDVWQSPDDHRRFVKTSFDHLVDRLDVPENVTVETITLTGHPALALLDYADKTKADVIAAGSHGHGTLARMVVGSVTTQLLRGSNRAVLVVPPDVLDNALGAGIWPTDTSRVPRARWRTVLDDFTRRNVGRRTRLEVDDPELGAQAQEQEYPLLGVTYDRNDDRIAIMLGELRAGAPHLTRSIGGVDALDLLTDAQTRDVALRIRHGAGQTLLTFPAK